MRFDLVRLEQVESGRWETVYLRKRGGGRRKASNVEVTLWKHILYLHRKLKTLHGMQDRGTTEFDFTERLVRRSEKQ